MQFIRHITVIAALAFSGIAFAHGGGEHLMGTVKTIDQKSLTIETKEKKEVKVLLGEKTKFEKAGTPATAKDLSVGERVVVHTAKKEGTAEPTAILVKFGAEHAHAEHGQVGAKESQTAPTQTVSLSVTDKGFTPENVKVKKGEPVSLTITRKTDKTCATEINIPDYDIKRALPLNEAVTVTFTPKKTGDVKYSCGMQMVGGVLSVE